jgi:hypothetical protein
MQYFSYNFARCEDKYCAKYRRDILMNKSGHGIQRGVNLLLVTFWVRSEFLFV